MSPFAPEAPTGPLQDCEDKQTKKKKERVREELRAMQVFVGKEGVGVGWLRGEPGLA